MESITLPVLFYATVAGFVPAFVWLYFWTEEDCHPEPPSLLVSAFVSGMLAIPVALLAQMGWQIIMKAILQDESVTSVSVLVGFAAIEELSKYLLVMLVIFWRKDYDEPVDAMIYLIAASLGFAAFENVLYLLPEFAKNFELGLLTGNLRFLGATLLHALSSGVVGFFVAHHFCSRGISRLWGVFNGVCAATLLHTAFNILILSTNGASLTPIVVLMTLSGLFLILAFDHIERVHQTCPPDSHPRPIGDRACQPS